MALRRYIFIVLIALAAGAAARAADLDKVTTKGNVSIQLPKGWPANAGTGRIAVAALGPAVDEDTTGKFQANFSVAQDPGTKVDAAAQQKLLAATFPQYQIVEKPTPAVAGGAAGVFFGGTFKQGKTELRTRQYVFLANNQIYTVTFTCLSSEWAKYQPALEASVATLSVKH